MVSVKNRVSDKQVCKMLIFDIISVSALVIPGISVWGAGRDGIFAIVLGSIAALGYGCFFLYISKKVEGDYLGYSRRALGRYITFLIGILYLIKILFSGWFTLSLFCSVLSETLLPNMDERFIIVSFILLGTYMAAKGIEVRARVSEVLFFIVLIPLFLILVFGLKNIEVTNLFPLFTTGSTELVKTSYIVLLSFSALEFLLFLIPFLTDKKDGEKSKGRGILLVVTITAVFHFILFVLVLGRLGIGDAGIQFHSSITILQVIGFPIGFLKRQDALVLMIWMFSIFTNISAYFYYLREITGSIIKSENRYGYYIFYGILMFFLCTIRFTPEKTIDYYFRYAAYIGIPQSVILPIIVLSIGKIRRIKNSTM